MRQTHPIEQQVNAKQQVQEVEIDFPLFRKIARGDNWHDDLTLTRIAEDGSSVSIRYFKAKRYAHETVEFNVGREAVDTGILDYTLGRGLYASSEPEFVALAALGARLLAQITQEVGPLPEEAAQQLLSSVNAIKQNGAREMQRSAMRS